MVNEATKTKRREEYLQKQEEVIKYEKKEFFRLNFMERTNVKSAHSKIKREVNLAMDVAEQDLNKKKNQLRVQLLNDESCLTYEYVQKAQELADQLKREKVIKAAEIVKRNEQERLEFVKRMVEIQRKNNCDDLRLVDSKERNKCMIEVLRLQMAEKEELRRKEKEIEDMYFEISKQVNTFETETAEKRKRVVDRIELEEFLKMQIEASALGKAEIEMYKEEEKQLMAEAREKMREEDEQVLLHKEKAKQALHQMLTEQVQLNQKLKMTRKSLEDNADVIFLNRLREELKMERVSGQAKKIELAKNLKEFSKADKAYKRIKEDLEKEELAKINKLYCEKTQKTIEEKFKIKKEKRQRAIETKDYWNVQLAEKHDKIQNTKDIQDAERRIYELCNADLDATKKMQTYSANKQYQEDVKTQINYTELLKEREKQMHDDEQKRVSEVQKEGYECALQLHHRIGKAHPFFNRLVQQK